MISSTVLAALAVGLGQLVKGVTGFGSALVAMPMLVALFGPRDALAVMVGVDTLTSLVLLPGIWKLIRWRLVLAVSAPLIAGQFVGTSLLFYVPERPVALLLGALVIALGGSIAWRPSPRGWGELDDLPPGSGPWLWLGSVAGFTGGCLQGLVGASGPPLVAWARRFFSDRFGRAHLIAVFAVGAVLLWAQLTWRTGGLGASGLRIAACIPTMLGGSLLGQWLAPRLSRELFGRLVGVLLVGAGLALLIR